MTTERTTKTGYWRRNPATGEMDWIEHFYQMPKPETIKQPELVPLPETPETIKRSKMVPIPVTGEPAEFAALPEFILSPEKVTPQQLEGQIKQLESSLRLAYPEMFDPTRSYGISEEKMPSMVLEQLVLGMEENYEGFLNDLYSRVGELQAENILRQLGVPQELILAGQTFKQQEEKTTKAIQALFPDFGTISEFTELLDKDAQLVSDTLRATGRTPESEYILGLFDFTEQDIEKFYAPPFTEREQTTTLLGESWDKLTKDGFSWSNVRDVSLSALGVVFGPVEKYVVRPWETAILEARARFQTAIGMQTEFDTAALQKLDELRSKYGWVAALVDKDVSDIWHDYVNELAGPAKIAVQVSDFFNPVFLVPIGGTFGLAARFTSKIPVLGKTLKGLATGVNAIERGIAAPIIKPLEMGVKGIEKVGIKLGEKAGEALLKRSEKLVMDIADSEIIVNGVVVDNWMRRSLQVMAKIPLVRGGVEKTLGTHILVDKTGNVVNEIVGRGAILNAQIRKMGVNLANIKKQELRAIVSNPVKEFGFNNQAFSRALARNYTGPEAQKGLSGTLEHVFSHPGYYNLTEKQLQYVTRFNELQNEVLNLLGREGIPPEHLIEDWVHRVIVDNQAPPVFKTKRPRAVGATPTYERPRKFETMAEGIEWFMKHPEYGKAYANQPELLIGRYVEEAFNKIAGERFLQYTGEFGITPSARLAERFPELLERAQLTQAELKDAAKFQSLVLRASRGEKLPEVTLKAMENRFPVMGAKLRALVKEPTRDIPHSTQAQGLLEKYKPLLKEVESIDFLKNPKEYDIAIKKLEGFIETLSKSEQRILDKTLEVEAVLQTAGKDLFGYPAPLNMSVPITTKNQAFDALNKEAKALVGERKAPYWQSRTEKALKMEQLRRPELGEGYVQAPFAGGKIYQQDFIDSFNKFFGYEAGHTVLKGTADAAGILRITKAALDFSAMAIQGLPSFGLAHAYMLTNPKVGAQLMGQWYKAAAYSVRGFFDPDSIAKYIAKNTDSITQRVSFGGSARSIDYFAALEARFGLGGLGEAALRKIPLKPFQRAETSFFGFSEIVRDEFWKILSPKALKQGKGFELARHLDLATGLTESAFQGVPLTTRQLEQSFLWFAPNYTRASLTLVADVFRGGMSGAQARKALGGLIAAGAGYYSATQYATSILAGKSEDEATEDVLEGFGVVTDPITGEVEWKPTGRFMTLKVGNYYFGIGGFWYGLVRLAGNIMATVNEVGERERIDLVRIMKHGSLNKQDNPFISWWFSRSSPFFGTGFELTTGKDYLGYPIETPEDYAKYIATRFEPIWMEQGLNWMIPGLARDNEIPEGAARAAIIPAELFGLRTFPESTWAKFYDKVNEYIPQIPRDELDEKQVDAWEKGKLTWKELTDIQKMNLLNRYPDLVEIYGEGQADSAVRASPHWEAYQSRIEEERTIYIDRLNQLTGQLLRGEIDTREYREKAGEAGQNFGAIMEAISRDPHYAEIYQYFEKKEVEGDKYGYLDDVALAEFQSTVLYAEDLIDAKGDYDWRERDSRIDAFIEKYGQDTYNRVQQYLGQKKEQKDVPATWIRKAEDTEKLGREYWRLPYKPISEMDESDMAEGNIPNEYRALWQEYQKATDKESFLEQHPELSKDWRAEYRMANPEDDARLALWGYGGRLQTLEAYNLVEKWGRELGVNLENMGLGLPPRKLVPQYFEYNELQKQFSGNSAEAKLYRLDNPSFESWGIENWGWKAVDDIPEVLRISAQYRDYDKAYEQAEDRQAYLEANPEYAIARRRRDAYQLGFEAGNIGEYIEWYTSPDLSKPDDWGDSTNQDRWYEDDWYLMEHPQFHQMLVDKGIFKQLRTFENVPTREVFDLWLEYNRISSDNRDERMRFRVKYPELDEWGNLAGIWSAKAEAPKEGETKPARPKTAPKTRDALGEREKEMRERLEALKQ